MKKRLHIVLLLIGLALAGIVVFQIYWTANAYQVNQRNFKTNVDSAMRLAMDDCKKDYFDSVRRILIKRLSPPETQIKLDTLKDADTANSVIYINISDAYWSNQQKYNTIKPRLNFYRKKINHPATVPELITEMSFYDTQLMGNITGMLSWYDIMKNQKKLLDFLNAHKDQPRDSLLMHNNIINSGILQLPPHYRQADSAKLSQYLKAELSKLGVIADFNLHVAERPRTQATAFKNQVITPEYSYKYQGFKMFNMSGPELFMSAVINNPQLAVVKNMITTLLLSLLLIVFVVVCFSYVFNTLRRQEKLSELKDRFINTISHELKTPIATATVAIEGIQNFNALDNPEKTRRYLQTARSELNRLDELVTKVLNVAAFEHNSLRLHKEAVHINELVMEVIAFEKEKTNKEVNVEYSNTSNVQILNADRLHLRNLLANLINNAVKYSNAPAGIAISVRQNQQKIIIEVKDEGPGISSAHIHYIFDKFYRAPVKDTEIIQGTGLGLSYVKYIAEAHGGTVTATSEINQGSIFTVYLPLS